jgi:ATP-dependent DNA helicase RecQ
LVAKARSLLLGGDVVIEPRRQWPARLDEPKGRITPDAQCRPGRALARLGDGGWDAAVTALLTMTRSGDPGTVAISPEMLQACADVLKRWDWEARPTWICPMPSRRSAAAIDALADALGSIGKLPVHRALVATSSDLAPADRFQADQANSAHQVLNVWHRLAVDRAALPAAETATGPVLLIDDEADSRWTLTVAAHRLSAAGAGPVLPFVLRLR